MKSHGELLQFIDGDPRLRALFAYVRPRLPADPGHDLAHALRVARWAIHLSSDRDNPTVVIAAALVHDIVHVPKDAPERANASGLAAQEARRVLPGIGFDGADVDRIAGAVHDHSFSRGATPTTDLGRALQDADRLDALGAIGIFRTVSTGALMNARYFDPDDPWAEHRALDGLAYTVDHFFVKLLRLPATMHTAAGHAEAQRRAAAMEAFLGQLADEIGVERPLDEMARGE